jgi:sugar O-acyltransferase (sialic acid O-acetyltransferase NeuD family)
MKRLHIIGAGGLAKELVGYILGEGHARYEIIGCWSDEPFNNSAFDRFYGGKIEVFKQTFSAGDCVILAIASPFLRRKVYEELRDFDLVFETYIHPSCEISPFAEIGKGCILAPHTLIVGDPILKDFVFTNTEVVVGHDTVIGEFCCLFPKVEICGDCVVEENCVFGINATVLPSVRVKKNSKVDAFSVLRDSFPESALFVGNPAKPVKSYKSYKKDS